MKTRFVKSVVATAKTTDVDMPWTRGLRREAMVAKRKEEAPVRRSA